MRSRSVSGVGIACCALLTAAGCATMVPGEAGLAGSNGFLGGLVGAAGLSAPSEPQAAAKGESIEATYARLCGSGQGDAETCAALKQAMIAKLSGATK